MLALTLTLARQSCQQKSWWVPVSSPGGPCLAIIGGEEHLVDAAAGVACGQGVAGEFDMPPRQFCIRRRGANGSVNGEAINGTRFGPVERTGIGDQFVGGCHVMVGRRAIAHHDFAQPLYASRANVPGNHRAQGVAVIGR